MREGGVCQLHDLFSSIEPSLDFFRGLLPNTPTPPPPAPIPHQKSNGPSLRCYQVLQLFSGPELIILDSSHETTRYYYSSPDMMTVHPMVTPPPLPSCHFIRFPWLISGTHLYSWVERGTVRVNYFAQKQNTWPGQVTNADLLTLTPPH